MRLAPSRHRQAGVPQERVGQVRGAADPLDPQVRLGDHLGQGWADEVGQLDGLEAGPKRIEDRDVGGVSEGGLEPALTPSCRPRS